MQSKDFVNPNYILETIISGAFLNGQKTDGRFSTQQEEYEQVQMWVNCQQYKQAIAEIEAAAVERFVKERFWNSACEVSACVAESGMQWAANRRKEAQG